RPAPVRRECDSAPNFFAPAPVQGESMSDVQTVQASTEVAEQTEKVNLLGLSVDKLAAFFDGLGEKRFRAVQVLKWIHQNGADDFDQMTNVSKALRAKLADVAEIRAPKVLKQMDSADGTRKWLIEVTGGN